MYFLSPSHKNPLPLPHKQDTIGVSAWIYAPRFAIPFDLKKILVSSHFGFLFLG